MCPLSRCRASSAMTWEAKRTKASPEFLPFKSCTMVMPSSTISSPGTEEGEDVRLFFPFSFVFRDLASLCQNSRDCNSVEKCWINLYSNSRHWLSVWSPIWVTHCLHSAVNGKLIVRYIPLYPIRIENSTKRQSCLRVHGQTAGFQCWPTMD